MHEYFDSNTEELLGLFQTFNGTLSPGAVLFFKNACKNNNVSYVYNFFAMFEQVEVRNVLVSKPEILNQILEDGFFELATFLVIETNLTYEELDSFDNWYSIPSSDANKKYIESCINYKNNILTSISELNYEEFVSHFNKIESYPKFSSLLKLIMNRLVKKDEFDFKMTDYFLKSDLTKKLYPKVLTDTLNVATFQEREDFIKYLVFDFKIPRTSDIEDLIYAVREMNLKAMFDSRDLYETLRGLKDKNNDENKSRGKI